MNAGLQPSASAGIEKIGIRHPPRRAVESALSIFVCVVSSESRVGSRERAQTWKMYFIAREFPIWNSAPASASRFEPGLSVQFFTSPLLCVITSVYLLQHEPFAHP
jgi:hypothetical protein